MRKLVSILPMIAVTLSSVGCVMVIGSRELPDHKHVVQIDDELYIVDVKTKRVKKLDLKAAIERQMETEGQTQHDDD